MPYDTDEKLKSYLDTNQLHREQMCRAILAADPRFTDVKPRHPRGGPDGGRDVDAVFRNDQATFGAVGFVNQANDSEEQKKKIAKKFNDDLTRALEENDKLPVFVFMTNVNLTLGEKSTHIKTAKSSGLKHCEIFDRERLRIALDSPDGFSTRFQYLNIPLSEEEQASFFARWGDDIQSVISTGFERVSSTLNRVLFLQELQNPLTYLHVSFQLDKEYDANEIGHFRLFCHFGLVEPQNNINSILFGSSDKSSRMRQTDEPFTQQEPGILNGISGGRWHGVLDPGDHCSEEKLKRIGASSSVGKSRVEFITTAYGIGSFFRLPAELTLRNLDEASFAFHCNHSLATKISSIHIYSNGYKLRELGDSEISIQAVGAGLELPVEFSVDELKDPWVWILPDELASCYHLNFFDSTPSRTSLPEPVRDSLKDSEN